MKLCLLNEYNFEFYTLISIQKIAFDILLFFYIQKYKYNVVNDFFTYYLKNITIIVFFLLVFFF